MSQPAPKNRLGLAIQDDGSYKIDGHSILASLGGVWGVLESAIPGTFYAIVYAMTRDAFTSVVIASALGLVFVVVQLLRRKPVLQALYGLIGIGIAAFLVLRGGADESHALDYYLPGFFTNIAYFVALFISVLVRWPLVGVLLGFFNPGVNWRKDKALLKTYTLVTGLWIGLFGLRLLVQVPLYLAKDVVALGFVKLFMSVPLYALCAWFTWLIVRRTPSHAKNGNFDSKVSD